MMANTTQESAGMPWNSVRIGEMKLSRPRERTISSASNPPTMKAPVRPANIRKIVASTSENIDPSENIWRQRQNTSISEGNRKRGKNNEANCQIKITATKGSVDDPSRFSAASNRPVSDEPVGGAVSLISPAPDRSSQPTDR